LLSFGPLFFLLILGITICCASALLR